MNNVQTAVNGSTNSSIRMGEIAVATRGEALRTLLGSCLGLALYDRGRKVGGLAHIVLPSSRGATDRPGKFVDTAIPKLIEEMQKIAGGELRLAAKLAGGASMFATTVAANIGLQNVEACRRRLGELRIPILATHCGGEQGRRMSLYTDSGKVVRTVDAGTQRSNRVKITPDGRYALVSDLAAGNLLILDAHQYKEVKRLNLGAETTGILIAPDGRTAYAAVAGADHVAVIDLGKLTVARTIKTGRSPDGMAWVP